MADRFAVWVYAVTGEFDTARLAGMNGVAGQPVHTVADAGLVAVVSVVPLTEFGEEALRCNLEDLTWLAGTARAHDAVIQVVSGLTGTVPIRLATVFRDDDGVRELLGSRRAEFEAALARIAGRTEWGVKAFLDPETAGMRPRPDTRTANPGTAYLLRRRAELAARQDREQSLLRRAQQVHAELGELAAAAREHPPQAPALTGRNTPMVLNAAYLVDDTRTAEFTATVDQLDQTYDGLRLELTGPWPPYSFTGLREDEP